MSQQFDKQIFGQQVEVIHQQTKQPNKAPPPTFPTIIPTTSKIPNKYSNSSQKHYTLPPTHPNTNTNKPQIMTNYSDNRSIDKYGYIGNCRKDVIEDIGKMYDERKTNYTVSINKLGIFDCFYCCQRERERERGGKGGIDGCGVCDGEGAVYGDNNMVKFIQYIMQFKLGIQPVYTPTTHPNPTQLQNIPSSKSINNEQYPRSTITSKANINVNANVKKNQLENENNKKKKINLSSSLKTKQLNNNYMVSNGSMQDGGRINQFCSEFFMGKGEKEGKVEKVEKGGEKQQGKDEIRYGMDESSQSISMSMSLTKNPSTQQPPSQQTPQTLKQTYITQHTYTYTNTNTSSNIGYNSSSYYNNDNASKTSKYNYQNIEETNISSINVGIYGMTQSIINVDDDGSCWREESKDGGEGEGMGGNNGNNGSGNVIKGDYQFIGLDNMEEDKSECLNAKQQRQQNTFNLQAPTSTKSMFIPTHPPITRQSIPSSFPYSHSNSHCQQQQPPKLSLQKMIHKDYSCNKCGIPQIVGIRYHCSSLMCNDDYDLCQECYHKYPHKHCMQPIAGNLERILEKIQNGRNQRNGRGFVGLGWMGLGKDGQERLKYSGRLSMGRSVEQSQDSKMIFKSSIH